MKKTIFLLTASLLVMATACSKKENNSNTDKNYPDIAGKTVRQILMMQDWKFTAYLDSADNDTKWLDQMEACNKDDVYSFFSSTKYLIKDNANRCYPTDQEVDYSMPNDNSNLVKFFDGSEWTLIYKSNEKLIFWRSDFLNQSFKKLIFTRN